ncbi:unnamed protein product [Acanthoscelides obtectus]|uniref:Uncharacterized protein n=1 Tax=Acanthoscelides obtectus TaxID=200917 RepID=A0A9P0QC58_ACAOB|nr:unnamed protein product [Acanthoscelides obtectus]CAK1675740.1 hypothetical protein AOBTE_LOCUS30401 [Acanthoscelides obtectus]
MDSTYPTTKIKEENDEAGASTSIKLEKPDLDDETNDDRIKKEPDPEEWDELNPTVDIPDKVELGDLTAVGVKVEPGDELDTSIKKEEMDTTQLNEEVDIKPDELPNADVDSDRMGKCKEKGLEVMHGEAVRELFICYTSRE